MVSNHRPSVDHIVALAAGGTNADANLRIIGLTCNSSKGAGPARS